MSDIRICGYGAVSPAGWSVSELRGVLASGTPLPTRSVPRPGGKLLPARVVPTPPHKPEFLAHPRLRRTSPISQFAVAASLEALGSDLELIKSGKLRLGIIFAVMCGCVSYSRRFYDEVLRDPSTASPLLFPETVFNAPASHLAALLGARGVCYTMIGDPGVVLHGIALGAQWLRACRIDRCLVTAAEELDWLTADASRLFDPDVIMSEGAAALNLSCGTGSEAGVTLTCVSSAHLFTRRCARMMAARKAREELGLPAAGELLLDGLQGAPHTDREENEVWKDWAGPRLSPKLLLGEAFAAAAGWQCVAAADCLAQGHYSKATVSVVGCNQQAIAARFGRQND